MCPAVTATPPPRESCRRSGNGTHLDPLEPIVLLVPDPKNDDDYKRWAEQIGKPSDLGVHLQVGISYSDRPGPHVVATGVVGVPRPPEDDLERQMLAQKVADLVEAPDEAVFVFMGLIHWLLVKGGPFEVELTDRRQIRELQEGEISNRVSLSDAGPLSAPVFRASFPETETWEREYRSNRYLRFESRAALSQRYQDLLTNVTVLTDDGHVDLTQEKHWHELFRHVVVEMFIRGEPPVPHNLDPSVAPAILFPDADLCARAAEAVTRFSFPGPYLVKYGNADNMRRLYDCGDVYLQPASSYRDPNHNQAVLDQELALVYQLVVANHGEFLKSDEVFANPHVFDAPDHRVLPLFRAPDAARNHVACVESHGPDAWLYCLSTLLAPRLFSDFNADACVVLRRDRFEARMCDALRPSVGQKVFAHGPIHYTDPTGAYAEPFQPPEVHYAYGPSDDPNQGLFQPFGPNGQLLRPPPVHFGKTFRFAYQREYRFVSYPSQPTERLETPLTLTLGPLDDIAEILVL